MWNGSRFRVRADLNRQSEFVELGREMFAAETSDVANCSNRTPILRAVPGLGKDERGQPIRQHAIYGEALQRSRSPHCDVPAKCARLMCADRPETLYFMAAHASTVDAQ